MTVLDRPRAAVVPVVRGSRWAVPLILAAFAGLARVPFLSMPLTPDEGGYLVVASQWSPGSSTYGNYFVDRPPLLVALFECADALGGQLPLRFLGIVAVSTSVLLAAAIGGRWAAATAAVFLTTPLFGTTNVDGELLAVPFVLASILLTLQSMRSSTRATARRAACAAGALAASAALVKQNMIDAIVFTIVVLAAAALRGSLRDATHRLSAFVAGGVAVAGMALGASALRGTTPGELWDALVTFRAQAAAVIDAYANDATPARLHVMLLALLLSGAPLLAAAAWAAAPRSSDLRWAALALVGWELAGAALGGSYWLHYLIALVPGLVVVVAAAEAGGRPGKLVKASVALSAASTLLAWGVLWSNTPGAGSDQAVSAYVRSHSSPDDTLVVAFGHPNIVRDAGLQSPYEHLWSLSVRVRDPRLSALADLLRGVDAPRWVVVDAASLATWGVDATRGQAALEQHYVEVSSAGDWHVFERR